MILGNRNFTRRLAKLEAVSGAGTLPRCFIVWDDDPLPDDLRAQDLIVGLAREAPSAEAWVLGSRRRL
jgi:hypothetical protein